MVKKINLALQGGGAHGAFTWGVLDRLLEEEDLEIAAISGTSAGALNGAVLKAGMVKGGRDGAKDALAALWQSISRVEDFRLQPWMQPWLPAADSFWNAFPVGAISKAIEYSPAFAMSDGLSRMMSPYASGPFYQNPLEPILKDVDTSLCSEEAGPCLFICTTNVRSGKIRVFQNHEVTKEVIMASACLPTLFQAVEIEGEAYWDGGYTGNPALFPMFEAEYPDDIVVVNINPLERNEVPMTPQDIQNRINEISFNSSLLREMRAIHFVKRLIGEGAVGAGQFKDVKLHMIADDDLMNDLSVATKLVPHPMVIQRLKDAGQRACDQFLRAKKDRIGVEGTVDLVEMFS